MSHPYAMPLSVPSRRVTENHVPGDSIAHTAAPSSPYRSTRLRPYPRRRSWPPQNSTMAGDASRHLRMADLISSSLMKSPAPKRSHALIHPPKPEASSATLPKVWRSGWCGFVLSVRCFHHSGLSTSSYPACRMISANGIPLILLTLSSYALPCVANISTRQSSPARHAVTTPSMDEKSLATKSQPGLATNSPRRHPDTQSMASPNAASSSARSRCCITWSTSSMASGPHAAFVRPGRPHQMHAACCAPECRPQPSLHTATAGPALGRFVGCGPSPVGRPVWAAQ